MLYATAVVHDAGAPANSFSIFAGLILFPSFSEKRFLLFPFPVHAAEIEVAASVSAGLAALRPRRRRLSGTAVQVAHPPVSYCWEVQMENLPTSCQPEGPKHQKWFHGFCRWIQEKVFSVCCWLCCETSLSWIIKSSLWS